MNNTLSREPKIIQPTLKNMFAEYSRIYIIPDFQRAYVWSEEQCETLWNDFYNKLDIEHLDKEFDRSQKYQLGVTIHAVSENQQELEIVDGQQRTISLSLLFRALYNEMPDNAVDKINIGKCIWHDDATGQLDITKQKVVNKMFEDDDKATFNTILSTGKVPKGAKDNYATNFIFFRDKVRELSALGANILQVFAKRILENVAVIQIVLEDVYSAIEWFTNHNAKNVPLSYTDIFKTAFCKIAQDTKGLTFRQLVANKWDALEKRCNEIFKMPKGNNAIKPLEYIFFLYTRKQKPFSKITAEHYAQVYINSSYLKTVHTLDEIIDLAGFLAELAGKKKTTIDDRALRIVFILTNINKSLFWELLTHLFFQKRNSYNVVDNDILVPFLQRLLAVFIGAAASGKYKRYNCIAESLKRFAFIFSNDATNVEKFSASTIKDCLHHLANDTRSKAIAKQLLYWLTFQDLQQPPPARKLSVEHIFASSLIHNRTWQAPNAVDSLGNLALLEDSLNKKASNLPYNEKALLYKGMTQDKKLQPTFNLELIRLAETTQDFNEPDILSRNEKIIKTILDYLDSFGLLSRDSIF